MNREGQVIGRKEEDGEWMDEEGENRKQ